MSSSLPERILAAIVVCAGAASAQDAEKSKPETWLVVERLVVENGVEAGLRDVLADLEGVVKTFAIPNRTTRVARGLREPWSVPVIAEEIHAKLASPFPAGKPARFDEFVAGIASLCDLEAKEEAAEAWARVQDPAVTGEALVAALSELVSGQGVIARRSIERLGDERMKALAERHREFAAIGFKTCDPKVKATSEEEKLASTFQTDLWKTKLAPSLSAASVLVHLADPAFLAGLPARLQSLPKPTVASDEFGGDVLAVFGDSPATRVVVGGKGKTTYRGAAALIIDLGGDDAYARAAVVDDPDVPASLVLDLGGNDVYEGKGCGPAYACGGVAMIVDVAGKDTYRGERLAIGSGGPGGFAMVVDYAGNDVYESQGYGQGYGLCGVGLLFDRAGDDRYDGWAYAQGSNEGWGLGALVDADGNDVYVADGHFADSYGDSGPNVFHGASQGSSFGLRSAQIPGGIGALVDERGRDDYRAGNFSQGGGYYLGIGVMLDGGGDDKNVGTRYSQGYGVHQAVGIRWDRGGNDAYATRCAANIGSAWDEGVGWFLDDAGNDTYDAASLSLGAAANTAIAIFVDGGGKDRYTSLQALDTQGGTGDSSYHKQASLAVFLDLGGQPDAYSRTGRKDATLTWQRWFGLFLDAPEPTMTRLLTRKPGALKGTETPGRDT